MKIDNTVFDRLVKFYELEDCINFYKLYNTSEYINSYHGWNHVRNFIWAVYVSSLKYGLGHRLTRYLMVTGIFHDINYQQSFFSSKNDEYFDEKNIDEAKHVWATVWKDLKFNEMEFDLITKLIGWTKYPEPDAQSLDDYFCFEDVCVNRSNFVGDIVVDCDHSMPMFQNYNFMAWQLLTYEFEAKTYEQYIDRAGNYLNDLKYRTAEFQRMWKAKKQKVIDNFTLFLNKVRDTKGEIKIRDVKPSYPGDEWLYFGPGFGQDYDNPPVRVCDHTLSEFEKIYIPAN